MLSVQEVLLLTKAGFFAEVRANGDGSPVAEMLHHSHAANVQVGIAKSFRLTYDRSRFVDHSNELCVFFDGSIPRHLLRATPNRIGRPRE